MFWYILSIIDLLAYSCMSAPPHANYIITCDDDTNGVKFVEFKCMHVCHHVEQITL